LVLAESCLPSGNASECETALASIEESDPTSDFYVLGSIQRIRGLAALEDGNEELAIHHFNRSLTIFEAAEDVYHTGVANLLVGENLPAENAGGRETISSRRVRSFVHSASRCFWKGQTKNSSRSRISTAASAGSSVPGSAASQLLMVRLAEATASRELLFRELVAVLQQKARRDAS
jgi:hypothetical protein